MSFFGQSGKAATRACLAASIRALRPTPVTPPVSTSSVRQ